MLVIAATGLKVPKEEQPRDYITDAEAVAVPETAYYVRRMMDGDLLPAIAAPTESAKPAKKATE